jgi:SAM-dependent methyltransferase
MATESNYEMPRRSSKGSAYDSIAACYDDLFGDHNPYYGKISVRERQLFDRWIPKANDASSALDIGCGTGLHTGWLASRGYRVVGLDVSREMIRMAMRKSATRLTETRYEVRDALDKREIEGEPFTVICCLGSSLNHISDWKSFATIIARRLRPNGVFLFSYDNLTGIDTIARTVLRSFEGYSNRYVKDILIPRLKAVIGRTTFRNHWRVAGRVADLEVGLTYESTFRWRGYLRNVGLEVQALHGVHVVNSFDRKVLRASAGILPKNNLSEIHNRPLDGTNWMDRFDDRLANACHSIAANVVGVAIKH